ncbi:hypothetical protein ACOMHN_012895 [Nucella lapillus]
MGRKFKGGNNMEMFILENQFDSQMASREQRRTEDTIVCLRKYLLHNVYEYMNDLYKRRETLDGGVCALFPTGIATTPELSGEYDTCPFHTCPSSQDKAPVWVPLVLWTWTQFGRKIQSELFRRTVNSLAKHR